MIPGALARRIDPNGRLSVDWPPFAYRMAPASRVVVTVPASPTDSSERNYMALIPDSRPTLAPPRRVQARAASQASRMLATAGLVDPRWAAAGLLNQLSYVEAQHRAQRPHGCRRRCEKGCHTYQEQRQDIPRSDSMK